MSLKNFKADLWLLLCTFFWGATFSAVRDALAYVSPFLWLGLRFLLGGLVLLPFCWRHLSRLDGRGWRDGLILGFFMFSGFALQTAGLIYTTASRSAFITGLAVVLVPPMSIVLLRSKLDPWQILGVLLAAVGLYLMSRPESGGFNQGDLYTALCAVCFALVVVLVQRYTDRHHPLGLIMVQILATVGLSGLMLALAETPRLVWSFTLIPDILATGVLATAGSLVIQFYWQRRTSPVRAAVIYTLEPVFAAGFAYLLLGETMGGRAWAGAGLILVGMLSAEAGKMAKPMLGLTPIG